VLPESRSLCNKLVAVPNAIYRIGSLVKVKFLFLLSPEHFFEKSEIEETGNEITYLGQEAADYRKESSNSRKDAEPGELGASNSNSDPRKNLHKI